MRLVANQTEVKTRRHVNVYFFFFRISLCSRYRLSIDKIISYLSLSHISLVAYPHHPHLLLTLLVSYIFFLSLQYNPDRTDHTSFIAYPHHSSHHFPTSPTPPTSLLPTLSASYISSLIIHNPILRRPTTLKYETKYLVVNYHILCNHTHHPGLYSLLLLY